MLDVLEDLFSQRGRRIDPDVELSRRRDDGNEEQHEERQRGVHRFDGAPDDDVPARPRRVVRHVERERAQGKAQEIKEGDQVREHRALRVERVADRREGESQKARDGASDHRRAAALPHRHVRGGGALLVHRFSRASFSRTSGGASASGAFWLICRARK